MPISSFFLRTVATCTIVSLFAHAQAHTQKSSHAENRGVTTGACSTSDASGVRRYLDRSGYYEWLTQDVRYIITDPERRAFKMTKSDEERENFIEAFWRRRDPTPDTVENEFKDEHYSRIAYANQRFASRLPGWRTDRGRF